jgi:hypothetical protein
VYSVFKWKDLEWEISLKTLHMHVKMEGVSFLVFIAKKIFLRRNEQMNGSDAEFMRNGSTKTALSGLRIS